MKNHPSAHRPQQSGIALVVVLVFLLALTAISLYGARQAVFGEKIARNVLDAQVARQAAEAALRDAEADLIMAEGREPSAAFCTRPGARPMAAKVAALVATGSCLAGICQLTDASRKSVDFNPAKASVGSSTPVVVGQPWWPGEKGGMWNNSFGDKPASKADKCTTFTGGVPLGTYTGVPHIQEVAQQPEYLIEYMGPRNGRPLFRLTARGFGYDVATQAVVQSYFLPPETE